MLAHMVLAERLKRIAIIFGCVILILGFFSHAILNWGYSVLTISLMTSVTAMSRNQESQRKVIAKRNEAAAARELVSA